MSSSLLHRWAWLPLFSAFWLSGLSTPAGAAADPASLASFDQAVQAVGEGSYGQAVEILHALTAQYPDRAGAWFWLARAQRGAGDLAAAQVAVDRAIELDPDSPDAHYLAGLLAWDQGDRGRASDHFASVVDLDPSSQLGQAAARHVSKIHWLDARDHAVALADAGQRPEARASFRALDQQRPGDPLVLSHLGSLDLLAGDAALALGELDQALERAPDDPWTRYWRALALRALDRQPEATVDLQAVAASQDADAADAARTALKPAAIAQEPASAAPARTATPI
ncbi:MAG: tetratricopeptide repeat protein, partial [Oligoflexia bacterium]|nr:tetratricopeptide repeat protein [Oligoflexia bacterium]